MKSVLPLQAAVITPFGLRMTWLLISMADSILLIRVAVRKILSVVSAMLMRKVILIGLLNGKASQMESP